MVAKKKPQDQSTQTKRPQTKRPQTKRPKRPEIPDYNFDDPAVREVFRGVVQEMVEDVDHCYRVVENFQRALKKKDERISHLEEALEALEEKLQAQQKEHHDQLKALKDQFNQFEKFYYQQQEANKDIWRTLNSLSDGINQERSDRARAIRSVRGTIHNEW